MSQPLHFDLHGKEGEGDWFRLYQCEHVTEGSYPVETAVPLGSHTNMIFCKHCWLHLKGLILNDVIVETLRGHGAFPGIDVEALMAILEESASPLRTARLRDVIQGRILDNPEPPLQSSNGHDIVGFEAIESGSKAPSEKPGANLYAHQ